MLGPKRRLLIYYHLTSICGIVSSACLAAYCLASFLASSPEEALGTINGVLKDARAVYASKQPDNRLEFHFEKIDQLFVARGVNTANLQFFLAREAPGSDLTATLSKSQLGNPDLESVEVHELKSKKTVYLKLSSRLKDQERWQQFAGIALVGALGAIAWLLLRIRRKLKGVDPEAPLLFKQLDPLILLAADGLTWVPQKVARLLPFLVTVREAKAAHEAAMPARPQTQKPTHMKALQMLVESGRIDAKDGQGRTPLQIAAGMGQTEVVDALLKLFANPDNIDQEGNTPLMAAVKGKHLGVVLKLLDWAPNLGLKNLEDKTALDLATDLKQEAMMQLFKKSQNAALKEPLMG